MRSKDSLLIVQLILHNIEKREIITLKREVEGNGMSLFDEYSAYHANEIRNFDKITVGRMYICFMVIWPRNDLVSPLQLRGHRKRCSKFAYAFRQLMVDQSYTRTHVI